MGGFATRTAMMLALAGPALLAACPAPDDAVPLTFERGRVPAAKIVADQAPPAATGTPETSPDAARGVRSKDFARRVERGRALTRAGDYTAAQAAFEELLREDPGHGKARAELGWAAYRAGNLVRAERETLTALEAATEPKRRGMLAYNLGRIVEARRQYDDALGWYRQSLRYRPNDVVQRRKASLELMEAGPADVDPVELFGNDQLPSLSAVCEALQNFHCEAETACSCDAKLHAPTRGGRGDSAVQAGYVHLQLGTGAPELYLALEGSTGWSVLGMGAGAGEVALKEVSVGQGKAAQPTWTATATLHRGQGKAEALATSLCARPRSSQLPWMCSAPATTRNEKLELVVRVDEGGAVVVRHKRGEAADLEADSALRVGRRPLQEFLLGYNPPN